MALIAPGLFALTLLTTAPCHADEKGNKLLREACKTMAASKAMTANVTVTISGGFFEKTVTLKGTAAALKPNFFRFEYKGAAKLNDKEMEMAGLYVADGKDYYSLGGAPLRYNMKAYTKTKLAEKPTELLGEWEAEFDAFFGGEKIADKGDATITGTEKVNGVTCDIVKFTIEATEETPERVITYAIGQKDKLIHRTVYELGPDVIQTNTLSDINLKAEKKPEDFTFTPPKDAKEIKPRRPRDLTDASSLRKNRIARVTARR
jgi:outer membrane lipoprotein-sorting protein